MPSPFPGIDPYLEAQGRWSDFHPSMICYISGVLNERLPDSYVTQIDERIPGEVRETWIEVLRLPEERLVTAIEILLPTNKASSGRYDYLAKRHRLLAQPIHLVEIDLLIGGRRLPMARPLPPGDCYAFVARAGRRPDSEVYAWSVRHPLPSIPVPLLPPDADVPVDLAALAVFAHERGRYERLIRYDRPLNLPLSEADRAWAEDLARQAATP